MEVWLDYIEQVHHIHLIYVAILSLGEQIIVCSCMQEE